MDYGNINALAQPFQQLMIDFVNNCHRQRLDIAEINTIVAHNVVPTWVSIINDASQPKDNLIYMVPLAVLAWNQPDWSLQNSIWRRLRDIATPMGIFSGALWTNLNNGAGDPAYFAGAGTPS